MRVGLTYDLKDDYLAAGFSELDTAELDSRETIQALTAAIRDLGHEPCAIGNVRSLAARLVGAERWDLVFNICEGLRGFGRESQVPALLDAYEIPYTFSDTLVTALTLHKGMAKHVVRSNGIPTPAFSVVEDTRALRTLELSPPLFVKPVAEGSSKGISAASLVERRADLEAVCDTLLARHRQPLLIETFLPGREFTVGVLGTGVDARVLAVMEVLFRPGADEKVYSYRNKADYRELVEYRLLADAGLAGDVEQVALEAWRCLGCRDAGRVDIRLDAQGQPQFLEVNPLAGLHPVDSDLPIMARLKGMSYTALIAEILHSTRARLQHGVAEAPAAA